jgi:hypothetical protein
VLDGVFAGFEPGDAPTFHAESSQTLRDADIEWLTRHVGRLVVGLLRRRGVLDERHRLAEGAFDAADPLHAVQAAAVQGVIAFGARRGGPVERFGEVFPPGRRPGRKALCADWRGFSLHAAVRVPAGHRDRLERLCRYVCRPPLAVNRVRQTRDGKVACSFRKPWRNGVAGVRLDPMTFLSRLAALIPPPRAHLLTYHGLLAPGASHRDRVVPAPPDADEAGAGPWSAPVCGHRGPAAAELRLPRRERRRGGTRRAYYRWAELMKRVFRIDVLRCERCGGRRKVLRFLTDPRVIERILVHLGLPTGLPEVAAARPPPGQLGFE